VIVAEREYDGLTGKRPDFKEFLMGAGPGFEGLNLTREHSPMRAVKLSVLGSLCRSTALMGFSALSADNGRFY